MDDTNNDDWLMAWTVLLGIALALLVLMALGALCR